MSNPSPNQGVKARLVSVGDTVAAPSRKLLGGMKLTAKFAVIGTVLIAPLLFVVQRYASSQNASRDFSQLELTGMDYVEPAFDALVALDDAREAAVAGATVDSEAVRAALGALDAVDGRIGGDIATSEAWSTVKGDVDALLDSPVTDPAEAYTAWSSVAVWMNSTVAASLWWRAPG